MGIGTLRPGAASSYLDHLPAVFQELPTGAGPGFLGRFLLAFEHVLTGVGDPDDPGLEELLDRVPGRYLNPGEAPAEFLDWLAGWVALALRADLDAGTPGEAGPGRERARALIAGAVPLYRLRGTKRGLQELIARLSGGLEPTITELAVPLQVGVSSTIGRDTRLGGGPPHYFHVLLRLANPDPVERRRVEVLIRAILDVEKPAHTRYQLDVLTPAMQIGIYSRIGVDTLLSPASSPGDAP